MSYADSASTYIVLADTDLTTLSRLRTALEAGGGMVVGSQTTEPGQVLALLNGEPDVLLLGANLAGAGTLAALVRQIGDQSPHTQVLLLATDLTSPDLSRAVIAGARGILTPTMTDQEIHSTIWEVAASATTRRAHRDRQAATRAARGQRGRVIVIFSPKGGVGCSILACNLSMGLQDATGKRVALLDYSLQFGTIGSLLDLQSPHHLGELVPHAAEIDTMMINQALLSHPSEIKVLLPPATLDQLEAVTTDSLVDIVEGIRKRFDYVIVDLWHAIEEATLAIMETADILLLVTTPEAPAIESLRRFIDMLKNYPHLQPKLQLVVNRHPSKGGVPLADVEARLALPALATIPSDGHGITIAINQGMSFVQKTIAGVAGRNLRAMAEALAVPGDVIAAPVTPPSRWRFSLHRQASET
ncbi:MAG TPA: AAA family ATPase [Chloroflexia bacterium]|nr:AAA family ATPase [Chloroflexia bacterium]